MDQYSILGRIGEGAHGIVFKAKNVETGETVALKKVALRKLEDGIPNQALREIKALQEIEENQHVVKLKDVFPHGTGFVLVFECDPMHVYLDVPGNNNNKIFHQKPASEMEKAVELSESLIQFLLKRDFWDQNVLRGTLEDVFPEVQECVPQPIASH
ncbi:cyclin-dependent kinase 20-like [Elgaria multicarinata webbii]|uniref:cyclin-dependent kinase 20-like n=1 Tax=Elgaria multicarinata webbii TaxID=159646 RepID=UPI002FCCD990